MARFNIPYWISNWWNTFWSREAPVTNLKISFPAKLIYPFIFLFAFKKKPRLVLTYWNPRPILIDLQLATWKSFPFVTAIIAYHLACFLRQVYSSIIGSVRLSVCNAFHLIDLLVIVYICLPTNLRDYHRRNNFSYFIIFRICKSDEYGNHSFSEGQIFETLVLTLHMFGTQFSPFPKIQLLQHVFEW